MAQTSLFENYKYCEICGKPLPLSYRDSLCPNCKEQQLFSKVKDYIRENDVTEYQVAAHFHIPLQYVKKWIKEGRIEYKDNSNTVSLIKTYCRSCGAPITFGTLCPKCLRAQNISGHSTGTKDEESHMRYLDKSIRKKNDQ